MKYFHIRWTDAPTDGQTSRTTTICIFFRKKNTKKCTSYNPLKQPYLLIFKAIITIYKRGMSHKIMLMYL